MGGRRRSGPRRRGLPRGGAWGHLDRFLHALGWVGALAFLGWRAAALVAGDAGLLFLANSLTPYLCLVPLVILAGALLTRRHRLWLPAVVAVPIAAGPLVGPLLRWPPPATAGAPGSALTVLTWNLHQENEGFAVILATLRAADADLVALQEVSLAHATALAGGLADRYPYQRLAPDSAFSGMALLSRQPLDLDQSVPAWGHSRQIATLTWAGRRVTIINVHAIPPNLHQLDATRRLRERQIGDLVDFVAGRGEPVIVLGDFNTTPYSRAYHTLTTGLIDAWATAGDGFGHTWPGGPLAAVPLPWLARIDYILHSPHWPAEAAWLGPWDGQADHRAVLARLTFATGP